MPILVARIDDRLIHGQVVIGWGRALEIERIVLVDAGVAESEFEQDLYRMAVPAGITIEFLTPDEAPARLDVVARHPDRTLVLTGSVPVMTELQRERPGLIRAVNLGGIHDGPGRREFLRYVYLAESELALLKAMAASGVAVSAQDLPTARPISLDGLAD
jgi:PTS system mannose-specific IIB component/fructoselysine and glucoselysine-specific PTS system IIB component